MLKGLIKGVVGQVKWSYYNAAAINGYTVTRDGPAWQMRGAVVMSDKFRLAQRPLFFVAPHEQGAWRWPIRSFEFDGQTITAELGPPES